MDVLILHFIAICDLYLISTWVIIFAPISRASFIVFTTSAPRIFSFWRLSLRQDYLFWKLIGVWKTLLLTRLMLSRNFTTGRYVNWWWAIRVLNFLIILIGINHHGMSFYIFLILNWIRILNVLYPRWYFLIAELILHTMLHKGIESKDIWIIILTMLIVLTNLQEIIIHPNHSLRINS